MNQQQFRMFIRLSQTGSLSQIAREMNLSQPTVTFHLRKLTESAGVRLYERRGDQIQFTSAGNMLLRYAKEIISLFEEAERVMGEFRDDSRGELLVGASHVPANYVLPPVFQRFLQEMPSAQLSIKVGPTPEMIEGIRRKLLDVAIVSTPPLFDEDMYVRTVMDDPINLILPASHPLAAKNDITLDDLIDTPFILQQKGATRDSIQNWEAKTGRKLNVTMSLSNIDAVQKMVALGAGCSILSVRSVADSVADGLMVTRQLPHFESDRRICIMYRKDRSVSERMQRLITLIYQETIG